MNVADEIEQLKEQIKQEPEIMNEGTAIIKLLEKSAIIKSTETGVYCDRLIFIGNETKEIAFQQWGLYYLALLNRFNGNYQLSLKLSNEVLALFEASGDKKGSAQAHNNLGNTNNELGNWSLALKHHQISYDIKKELGDRRGIASSLMNIGNTYERQGKYPEALESHFECLKYSLELEEKALIAGAYNNIGNIYNKLENFKTSLEFHNQSLKIQEEIGNKLGIAQSISSIASVYENTSDLEKALFNQLAALKIFLEVGYKLGIATVYGNLGGVYSKLSLNKEALDSYNKSLKLYEDIRENYGVVSYHINIGNIHFKDGNYPEALKSLYAALEISDANDYKEGVKDACFNLYETYKSLGEFENALIYYERFHKTEDEMLGEQAKRQLTQLSFEHDFAKKVKDAEIAALKVKELETQKLWADLSSIHVGLSSNFLKNAFHTLSLEIKNNSQAALDLTDKLKDYYLGLLGRAKSKEPKLSDEIRSVGTYLQLHDLMRPGSIEYHPCIEETLQTDKMPFPAFVLQPIVENAIKHGIDKKDIPRGRIDLRITQNPGFVSVEIIDDGPGITASKKATAQHSYSTGAGINFIVEAVKRFNLQNKGITITFNPDLHISDVISNNRAEGCRVQIIISENFSNDKLHNN